MQQELNKEASIPFSIRLLATGFLSGYSPVAPGTAGSLVGLLLYLIPGMEHTLVLTMMTTVLFFVGVYVSNQLEQLLGEDPQIIVVDEIIGMWISFLLLPKTLWTIVVAFVFFRVYDTIKPPPARKIEKIKHGWGIMLDDVVAGIYANITVRLVMLIFSRSL